MSFDVYEHLLLKPLDQSFSGTELNAAYRYVISAFFQSAMTHLNDQVWLQKNENSHDEVFGHLLADELSPLQTLFGSLSCQNTKEALHFQKEGERAEKAILAHMRQQSFAIKARFLRESLEQMAVLFRHERTWQQIKKSSGGHLGLNLYRTFDGIDDMLGLDYKEDSGMPSLPAQTERLYEGAGVGVQSGYSTILTALDILEMKSGEKFIDLGSGYGRVGFVMGFTRPDIEFQGFEYVPHRVDFSNKVAEEFSLEKSVTYFTQDLSSSDFEIPLAEYYYLYDPFSESTYRSVLSQLVKWSRKQKVTIITKGNARGWLVELVQKEGWPAPQYFDSGNLCLFVSR